MINNQELSPVKIRQELIVVPDGIGKQGDAFVRIDSFMLFIKAVPEDKVTKRMKIRVITIKANCGIAVYIEEEE